MRVVSIAVLTMALAACGGGGGGGGDAAPAPQATTPVAASGGTAEGQVTGFGSVIVDGVRYDDSQARVVFDDDPQSPRAATTDRLRLGMRVAVKHDGASVGEVSVESSLKGRVDAKTASGLQVLGRTVTVVASGADATLFEGYGSLADIAVGDYVEVHAVEAAGGSLQASRIERASSTDATLLVKLEGRVSALDAAARTFKVGGATVRYGTASVTPANAVLANDQRVVVYSTTPYDAAASTVQASKVKVKDRRSAQAGRLTVGGVVADLQADRSFTVSGFKVDARNAAFEHGSAAELANGVRVKVEGVTNGDVLAAREIEFKRGAAASAKTELTGPVTDLVGTASFGLRGQRVHVDGRTEFKDGAAAELAVGTVVKVEGTVVDGRLVAREVKLVERSGQPAGARPETVRLEGPVYGLAPQADPTSFVVSDVRVAIDARTVFEGGTRSQLAAGVPVKVKARTVAAPGQAATLVATEIEFRQSEARGESEVRGLISEFVSRARFRVAGQLVDASAAAFDGGTEAALRNGQLVEIEGRLVDGVLRAAKVEFED